MTGLGHRIRVGRGSKGTGDLILLRPVKSRLPWGLLAITAPPSRAKFPRVLPGAPAGFRAVFQPAPRDMSSRIC